MPVTSEAALIGITYASAILRNNAYSAEKKIAHYAFYRKYLANSFQLKLWAEEQTQFWESELEKIERSA